MYLPITLELDEPEGIDPTLGMQSNSQPPSDPNTPTKSSSSRVKAIEINLDPSKDCKFDTLLDFLSSIVTNGFVLTAASNRQRSERSLSGNNKNFRSGGKRSSTISQEIPQKRKKRPGYDD